MMQKMEPSDVLIESEQAMERRIWRGFFLPAEVVPDIP